MRQKHQIELERLGLSAVEAQIYLALLKKGGTWRASAVAATMQIPRSTVYLALNSLLDRGLLEAEAGYGGRFSAVPADRGLPSLIAAERAELSEREKELLERESVANSLAEELKPATASTPTGVTIEVVQVLRDSRAVAERYRRLLLGTERSQEVFCKAPIFVQPANPVTPRILRRGVRVRALYEPELIEIPAIREDLADWVRQGEEVRVYDGELPHKLAIFDRRRVLAHLQLQGDRMRTLYSEHPELAKTLGIAFDTLWLESKPLILADEKRSHSDAIRVRSRASNGETTSGRK
jgi:sugar-specific transcriptional regulator TrmB